MSRGDSKHDHRRSLSAKGTALDTALVGVDRGAWSPSEARQLIARILDATTLDYDERVEVLGGALVSEAVRPHWESGLSAGEAHDRLCRIDPELAEVIEAVGGMLLSRAEAQDDARTLIGQVQSRLLSPLAARESD
ncbi:MAG: hypothetical protein ABIP13_03760 [Tepidiformaceae bacterium]